MPIKRHNIFESVTFPPPPHHHTATDLSVNNVTNGQVIPWEWDIEWFHGKFSPILWHFWKCDILFSFRWYILTMMSAALSTCKITWLISCPCTWQVRCRIKTHTAPFYNSECPAFKHQNKVSGCGKCGCGARALHRPMEGGWFFPFLVKFGTEPTFFLFLFWVLFVHFLTLYFWIAYHCSFVYF